MNVPDFKITREPDEPARIWTAHGFTFTHAPNGTLTVTSDHHTDMLKFTGSTSKEAETTIKTWLTTWWTTPHFTCKLEPMICDCDRCSAWQAEMARRVQGARASILEEALLTDADVDEQLMRILEGND